MCAERFAGTRFNVEPAGVRMTLCDMNSSASFYWSGRDPFLQPQEPRGALAERVKLVRPGAKLNGECHLNNNVYPLLDCTVPCNTPEYNIFVIVFGEQSLWDDSGYALLRR